LKRGFTEFLKRKALRFLILQYYRKQPEDQITEEIRKVIEYLQHHPVNIFPYNFKDKYKIGDIDIQLDARLNLYYVMMDGKKLYYKNGSNMRKARKYFKAIITEQDPLSPHRYLTDNFNVEENQIVADIGSGDGNFGLSIVEKVRKLFLFEPEKSWHKALQATFKPWQDKIEIVSKMVSDENSENSVSLNRFFAEREKPDFIKIDVEGFENKVIMGSSKIFEDKRNIKLAICTYHKQDDFDTFSLFFKNAGFSTSSSPGYMIFRRAIKKPYLRRGILRVWR
jgi:hypothetical protein